MPEIIYWILSLTIVLLALPLVFFLGIMAAVLLLILIISSGIFWMINFYENEPTEILITFGMFILLFLGAYFFSLVFFATLGFGVLKFLKNSEKVKLIDKYCKDEEKKTLRLYAKIFFMIVHSKFKELRWVFWIILPILIIIIFIGNQEINTNEFWI